MRKVRMTYFPILEEIMHEYVDLRQKGNDRATSVGMLMESYAGELEDADDAQLFWIGLADAQYSRKELEQGVAQKALHAVNLVESFDWNICAGDLNRRREHYEKAPMPERAAGKPRPKFRCEWKIGDTFAYQLTSQEAKELGIYGKYMLLRKVSDVEFGDGSLYPIVTLSLWSSEKFPQNTEEFMSASLLKLCNGGRMFSPKEKYEYRAELVIKSRRQLRSKQLIFAGNFSDVMMPSDEIVFTTPGVILMIFIEKFEQMLCHHWRLNSIFTSNEKLS